MPGSKLNYVTSSELSYQFRGYVSMMSKYATPEYVAFEALWFALASMTPSVAEQLVADVRSAPFQLLPHFLLQNVDMDISQVGKFNVASSTYSSLETVFERLLNNEVVRQLPTQSVMFANSKFVSVGDTPDRALNFLKVMVMSTDSNNMDALLAEVGRPFELPWKLVNSKNFQDGLYSPDSFPPKYAEFFRSVLSLYRALTDYVICEGFAMLAAVYTYVDRVDPPLLELCRIVSVDFLHIATQLLPIYSSSLVEDAFERDNLEAIKDDTGDYPFDPWCDKKPELAEMSAMVKSSVVSYQQLAMDTKFDVSPDDFALHLAAVDRYGEAQRGIRAVNKDWDIRSKEFSKLLDVDPAVAYINSRMEKFVGTLATSFIYSNASSTVARVPARFMPVEYFGDSIVGADHSVREHRSFLPFVQALKLDADKAFLVVDSLRVVFDPGVRRSWITVADNVAEMKFQIKLIEHVVGTSSDHRMSVEDLPRVIVWRCVRPYDRFNYNNFAQLVTRLDVYYTTRYYPPANPHESQFTLVFERRAEINPGKFVGYSSGRGRRLNFVLDHVEMKRRYYGIAYRKMAYEHSISFVASKVVSSIFLKAVARGQSLDYGGVVNEFVVQQKHYPAEVILKAREHMINYIGLRATSRSANKSRRVAEKKETDKFIRDLPDTFNRHFSHFNN